MVRFTAIALLAFAASALAAPQGANNGGDQIFDFNDKPLKGDKKTKFLDLEKQGDAKFEELTKTYTPEQQQLENDLNSIHSQMDDILGVPKQQQK
ncbi:uncharacterized protein G6M90_00g065900 [Metarhizium brunneum]|uniref:Uncharacterized protein n=1 Tax=Metarhizium brunneum TaxID=500148 RepID=A0A7D5UYJ7_9HYPO